MKWRSRIKQTNCWLWVVLIGVAHPLAGAQTSPPPRTRTDDSSTLAPLPVRATERDETTGVAPPPLTPASILAGNAQPIDLNTALELANVQNPEFNVARTRILEERPPLRASSRRPIFCRRSIPA